MENQYVVLKNGKVMQGFTPRSLDQVIWLIRELEKGLDRATQHSPYTIDLAN